MDCSFRCYNSGNNNSIVGDNNSSIVGDNNTTVVGHNTTMTAVVGHNTTMTTVVANTKCHNRPRSFDAVSIDAIRERIVR